MRTRGQVALVTAPAPEGWAARTEQFEELRPLLFSIAHRLLRNPAEAEDAVQESWLRYATSVTDPTSPKAFLSAVVTRICLDVLRSARSRRELSVGSSPEAVHDSPEAPHSDPAVSAELAESVSVAVLTLFERLSPVERAVFVLRELLAFGYADVAAAVGRSEAACRQVMLRARRRLAGGRRRSAEAPPGHEPAARLADALRQGDVAGARALVVADLAEGSGVPGDRTARGETWRPRAHRGARPSPPGVPSGRRPVRPAKERSRPPSCCGVGPGP